MLKPDGIIYPDLHEAFSYGLSAYETRANSPVVLRQAADFPGIAASKRWV